MPMALQVNLTLSKTYFLPGEVVQVSVQICNDEDSTGSDIGQAGAPQVIHIKELSFLASGSERTDPSFIHRLHRPDVPVEASDARRQVRSIFTTEPAVLVSDQVLAPHAVQHFQLRFRLPSVLPPSYRGSAVRFLYHIQVKAVYEVHRGGHEAVMYETTASTPLIVWPGSGVGTSSPGGPSGTAPDRRTSSLDINTSGSLALGAAAAAVAGSSLHRETSHSSSSLGPESGGAGVGPAAAGGESYWRSKGAGGAPSAPPSTSHTPHSASFTSPPNPGMLANGHGGTTGGGGQAGGRNDDDGDIVMCDYALGRKCRIKWKEVRSGEVGLGGASGSGVQGDLPRPGDPLESAGSSGVWASAQAHGFNGSAVHSHRGLIPFGINRPYTPPFSRNAAQTVEPDLDSDTEDGRDGSGGGAASHRPSSSVGGGAGAGSSAPQAHVQRQLSSGAGGGTAGAFGRQSSRRGSLFGKVYNLNVREHPLLRLLLQAPLEVPLQPGATFGGVLDFRPPLLAGAAGGISAVAGGGEPPQPIVCYDVVVLLESEELVSPECRLQGKRDGSGIPAGAPYVIRRLHGEHHELTSDRALTCFTFSLPASATPSFRTPMVSLRWVLRFELTVGPRISFAAVDKRARAPRPALEQLVWSLPLVVRPPVAIPR